MTWLRRGHAAVRADAKACRAAAARKPGGGASPGAPPPVPESRGPAPRGSRQPTRGMVKSSVHTSQPFSVCIWFSSPPPSPRKPRRNAGPTPRVAGCTPPRSAASSTENHAANHIFPVVNGSSKTGHGMRWADTATPATPPKQNKIFVPGVYGSRSAATRGARSMAAERSRPKTGAGTAVPRPTPRGGAQAPERNQP